MAPLLTRPAFRRTIASQETRLARVARGLVRDLAQSFGADALRQAAQTGGLLPSAVARARDALEARKPALQQALLGTPLPIREQTVPEIALRIATFRVGDLIREIELQQLHTIRWQLSVLFDRGPEESLVRQLGETAGLTERMAAQVLRAADAARAAGASDVTAERVARQLARELETRRGRVIARTEAVRFTNAVVQERGRELGPGAVKQWVSARDDRVDPVCRGLDDGSRIPVMASFAGGYMQPPAHPGCFLGDTLVASRERVTAQSERWYDGEIVVIRTAGGKHLACTPQHPILTDCGWVAAGALDESCQLLCDRGVEWVAAAVYDDYQLMPTRIEQVADALWQPGEMAVREVPLAAEDFHGDGMGSKVAVIRSDRLLRDRADAVLSQPVGQALLHRVQVAEPLHGHGSERAFLEGGLAAARRAMRSLDLPATGDAVHLRPLEAFGLASPPDGHALFAETMVDHDTADLPSLSEFVDRGASQIVLDQVVDVHRSAFHGLVYNLETMGGWYIANGILARNCRCLLEIDRP